MGGFAEYTGSLVLSFPIAHSVMVAVTPRTDQLVSVVSVHHQGNGEAGRCNWPLASFYSGPDTLADPAALAAAVAGQDVPGARDIAAGLYAVLESKALPDLGGGLTFAVRSALHDLEGVGAPGATTAAALIALARVFDLQLQPMTLAELAKRGQNRLWGRAEDIADAATAALAQADAILQVRCRSREVVGSMPLPRGLALTGIHCGARSPNADQKYIDARVAAFMGRNIINRILNAGGRPLLPWDGFLSQLSVTDYVERLRDRLPTRIRGVDFVTRFGQSGDNLTTIDPDKVYKIRSRTEHHIYENARSWQFAERLARAARTNDLRPVEEAGGLMYASHWSYGQRCGLGSIPTDKLVNLLRSRGLQGGIFGAKITGRGAGGTVVVLHADTDAARQAIAEATDEYAAATGNQPQTLTGTSPGALAWGVQEIA
jgi:L-arabinokinase